jgi:hypothetical protein
MKFPVNFRIEAQNDVLETVQWYEDKLPGLGDEFFISFTNEINNVCKTPLLYEIKYKGIRQAIIRKFPYNIFFKITNEKAILVFAVLHMSRNPKVWKRRFA